MGYLLHCCQVPRHAVGSIVLYTLYYFKAVLVHPHHYLLVSVVLCVVYGDGRR